MRKAKTVFSFLGMMMLGFCAISVMAAQADFSGTWALDKGKTRGIPKDLKNYTLVVTQNEQQLVVETTMNGAGSSEPTGSVTGVQTMRGGVQRGSAGGGGGVVGAGTLALSMVNPNAIYSLDGKEKTVQFPGSPNVKVKAKWAKDGKTLDLSMNQPADVGTQTPGVSIKERWTLSDGGEVLKIQRSVGTGSGSDSILLIFKKGSSGAPTPQP